jgi:hypothetical protein
MKAFELYEGRGIAAREKAVDGGQGAIFTNAVGETIELQDMVYFPPEGRYEDDEKGTPGGQKGKDKVQSDIIDWMEENDISPKNFKMVNNPMPAAALSVWKNQDGETVVFGRYATSIRTGSLGINWTNTQFAKETGYVSGDKVTQTETLPLKPSDIFPDGKPRTVKQVLAGLRNLPDGTPDDLRKIIPEMVSSVARGKELYTPGSVEHRQAIENYVGEYAAAMALMTGNFVSGDYEAAAEQILLPQGGDWNAMTLVQFPTSTTTTLVDSYLMSADQSVRIAISSKAAKGGGAAASLWSVVKILQSKRDDFKPAFLRKHKELIEALIILAENSAIDGVYLTGKLYGFLSDADIKIINYLIKSFHTDEKILTVRLRKLAATYPSADNLERTKAYPNYNLGYRLLAAVARKVAERLNKMNPTDLFRGVLAKSSMIQVYARTQKKGDSLSFVDFNVVYPPQFDGLIQFDAQTNFYSTDKPKGRMTFKLK